MPKVTQQPKRSFDGLSSALAKVNMHAKPAKSYAYPIKAPDLMRGVVPSGQKAPVEVANDSYEYAQSFSHFGFTEFVGFPGYPYLSMLSTRAEYRMFAQAISNNLTREWIKLVSTNTDDNATEKKIAQLTKDLEDLKLKEVIALMADHDSFYGRAQMFIDILRHDEETRELPLLLSPKTIEKREFKEDEKITKEFRISAVEAMWTTPCNYNATDPSSEDFYVPIAWFMMGKKVHKDRLATVITRPVTDMLKPAFNFGGMSMSQLAEPYVDNWLRTRQSVSDLINNFSIVTLQTAMEQVLQGGDGPDGDGTNLFKRADLFTATRNNKGIMLLDKATEEIVVQNVPLGGLSELQAQSQEQMCSVSHIPAVILLGISPTGFGNLAEGEIKAFYDWMRAMQYRDWNWLVIYVLQIVQLIRYGEIDQDITVKWQPLYQMTPKEESELRKADAERDATYIDRQVLDPSEVREKLARNPDSGYEGIDISKVPVSDNDPEDLEAGDVD